MKLHSTVEMATETVAKILYLTEPMIEEMI